MAYLTGVRAAVVALLDGNIGDRDVWEFHHEPDQLLTDAVIVTPATVRPPEVGEAAATIAVFDLLCVSATTIDAPALDQLEDFLGDVLTVIDAAGLYWRTAEYVVWDETHPAYKIEMEYMT